MEEKEGSAWFWKIFGGAIIGMVTLLSITLLNVINNTNQQQKSDLVSNISEIKMDIKSLSNDLNAQKEKLSGITGLGEEVKSIRDKLNEVSKTVIDRNEKIAVIESNIEALKQKTANDSYKELYEKIISMEQEIKLLKDKSKAVTEETEAKKTSLLRR